MTALADSIDLDFEEGWLLAHRVDIHGLSLDDIVGVEQVVAEVRSLVGRLRNPEIVRAAGAEMPRGILLFGPPGVGKTLTARVMASMVGDDIPFFEVSSDELSAPRIRGTVRYLSGIGTRSVLYIDEIDGFARDRSDPRHSPETRQLLYAALAALDGLRPSEGPILIASTNDPPHFLDGALLRAGRVGFRIEFGLPEHDDRVLLLKHFSQPREFDGPIDFERIARIAEGTAPADLRQILDDALGLALGQDRMRPTQQDVVAAARRQGAIEPERGDPMSRTRIALHEAGHAIVGASLVAPDYVRSIRVTGASGSTRVGEEWEMAGALAEEDLRNLLAVSYGGLAAERRWLKDGSTASLDDFEKITGLLLSMSASGLVDEVPPISPVVFRRLAWRDLRNRIGEGATRLAKEAQARAKRAIDLNGEQVLMLSKHLEDVDELSGPDLQRVLLDLKVVEAEPMDY